MITRIKSSITLKVVLSLSIAIIAGLVVLVMLQLRSSYQDSVSQFVQAVTVPSTLITEQISGGLRWKKQDVVQSVYAKFLEEDGNSLSDVLVVDDAWAAFDEMHSGLRQNYDFSNLLEQKRVGVSMRCRLRNMANMSLLSRQLSMPRRRNYTATSLRHGAWRSFTTRSRK